MGANHQKEIKFLASICKPDFGYITNFGKAHLEGFGGVEGVIKGKCELYDYIKNNDKIVFVNPKDKIQLEKTKDCNSIFFDTSISFLKVNPFVKIKFKSTEIQCNLIGAYNYSNIAIAITIGNYFKVSENEIKTALESYKSTNNRSQIIEKKDNTIILDAYNANPSSMKAALENFAFIKEKNKTVILGDMFELGESSRKEHQSIASLAVELQFDNVILVGENFDQVYTNSLKFKAFNDLEKYLKNNPLKDQSILIKGSRGMRLERLLDTIC
jgi:UDP-N-acetylmuramoyl-tripeptide--D-alanyl-D-alanine ligase